METQHPRAVTVLTARIYTTGKARRKALLLLRSRRRALETLNNKLRQRLGGRPLGLLTSVPNSPHPHPHSPPAQLPSHKPRSPFPVPSENNPTLSVPRPPLRRRSRRQIQRCSHQHRPQNLVEHRFSPVRFVVCLRQEGVLC